MPSLYILNYMESKNAEHLTIEEEARRKILEWIRENDIPWKVECDESPWTFLDHTKQELPL